MHARVGIVTAGVRQRPNESREQLLQRNAALIRPIVLSLVRHSPHTKLLIVSNPVDVMTHLAWKVPLSLRLLRALCCHGHHRR